MSRLSDIEKAIKLQLEAIEWEGAALFAQVSGASGPVTPGLRQALRRQRMPAAYVVFLSEPLTPETAVADRGPRYAVLLADRALRAGANPREGDADVRGLYLLIELTRQALDGMALQDLDATLTPVAQHVVESDARCAVAQITYQARPNGE